MYATYEMLQRQKGFESLSQEEKDFLKTLDKQLNEPEEPEDPQAVFCSDGRSRRRPLQTGKRRIDMTKDGFRRFKGHEEFVAWLCESGYEQCCSFGCGVVLSRDGIYAVVVRDPGLDEDGYVSFTDWIDEEVLASCNSVMEVQEMFEGYAWSCIDDLVLDEEGNLFHLKRTLLEQGQPGRPEPEDLAAAVVEKLEEDGLKPEFNRQESIIIESFLDLYCHDCPDKTQCEGCRMSDVYDYLDDMGDLDLDR